MPVLNAEQLRAYAPAVTNSSDPLFYSRIADGMDREQAAIRHVGLASNVLFDTETGRRVFDPPLPVPTPEQAELYRARMNGPGAPDA